MLRAPCCNEIFWCRLCHNKAKMEENPDPSTAHEINRHAVTHMVCALCKEEQPVGQYCRKCGVCNGLYYCAICKFLDDDFREQFHCGSCNICRVGGRENFFHCDTCGERHPPVRPALYRLAGTTRNLRRRRRLLPRPPAAQPQVCGERDAAELPGLPGLLVRDPRGARGAKVRARDAPGLHGGHAQEPPLPLPPVPKVPRADGLGQICGGGRKVRPARPLLAPLHGPTYPPSRPRHPMPADYEGWTVNVSRRGP